MDIQATKLELMRLLLNTQKEHVLEQLQEVFEREESLDSESDAEHAIDTDMLESAKRSNEDIKAGRVYNPDEAEERLEKRFGT